MGIKFFFREENSSIFGKIYRPVAQVFFFSKNNQWIESWMIIDTGADYSLLPKYMAEKLGVNLKKDCQMFNTRGVGGEEKVYLKKNLKVKIGNWERAVPVGFLDKDNIPPLLGRQGFLETFEVLFSSNHTVSFSVK